VGSRSSIAATTRAAMDDARTRRGVSTLIVPEDFQQSAAGSVAGAARSTFHSGNPSGENTSTDKVEAVIAELRQAGGSAVILLGGAALSRAGQQAAGRIAATTGARLFSETFPARAERGGGLPDIDRLPYFPEAALAVLKNAPIVVLVGATEPIAYFGYDGVPSTLAQPGTLRRLAGVHDDAEARLCALADLFADPAEVIAAAPPTAPPDTAALPGRSVGATLATLLPEGAIVSIEGGTCGYPFYTASAGAVPHSVLTNTGGAIGQGLPCALGAAIAAPDRPVIALQSDGSGLYTAQALWTMAREGCDVVVLIAANHTYNVLRTELARHGHSELGPHAAGLTSLADPPIDWVALANGFGVEATRVETVRQLHDAFTPAVTRRGPHLIEMTVQP
jgi:acetolactate synthase-1/2/3 large subunit